MHTNGRFASEPIESHTTKSMQKLYEKTLRDKAKQKDRINNATIKKIPNTIKALENYNLLTKDQQISTISSALQLTKVLVSVLTKLKNSFTMKRGDTLFKQGQTVVKKNAFKKLALLIKLDIAKSKIGIKKGHTLEPNHLHAIFDAIQTKKRRR